MVTRSNQESIGTEKHSVPYIRKRGFGKLPDGAEVHEYTLGNPNGMQLKVLDYGCIITECWVPDSRGDLANVVLGFNNLEQYLGKHPRFGSTIGRYANRIAGAEFVLDGVTYKLALNHGNTCIHGGVRGFDKVLWQVKGTGASDTESWIELHYLSPDMEEGFPGNLSVSIIFALTTGNDWKISYSASSDKATPINLTNHSYFNLRGAGNGNILDHLARFSSDTITPLDENSLPTGELVAVAGTAYDFRKETSIGKSISDTGGGYDINYVVGSHSLMLAAAGAGKDAAAPLAEVATVRDAESGRTLTTFTDQPGFQFFTANGLDASISGNGGAYVRHAGFCIETQHFADSVHHPNFPSTILRPGQQFRSRTCYRFST